MALFQKNKKEKEFAEIAAEKLQRALARARIEQKVYDLYRVKMSAENPLALLVDEYRLESGKNLEYCVLIDQSYQEWISGSEINSVLCRIEETFIREFFSYLFDSEIIYEENNGNSRDNWEIEKRVSELEEEKKQFLADGTLKAGHLLSNYYNNSGLPENKSSVLYL